MANPTYVTQLQALKAKLATEHAERVEWTTATLTEQYNKQVAFIDDLIAQNS